MTDTLEAALKAGQVTPLESDAYRCEVCSKKYVSKATIKNHLITNMHRTKLLSRSPAEATSCDVERQTLVESPDQVENAAGRESSTDRLEAALKAGQVIPLEGGAYRCVVCEKRYGSKMTVKTHLTANTHLTKLQSPSPAEATACDVVRKTVVEPYGRLHKNINHKREDAAGRESSTDRLEAALNSGQVVPLEGGAYRCVVCDKRYVSKMTVKTHLTANTHLTKVASRSAYALDGVPSKLLPEQKREDTAENEPPTEKLKEALMEGQVTPLEGGAYRCEVCDKNYVSKITVKNHLTTNTHRTKFQSCNWKKIAMDGTTRSRMSQERDALSLEQGGSGSCVPRGTENLPGRSSTSLHDLQEPEPLASLFPVLEYPHDTELPPGRVYVFNYIYFLCKSGKRVENRTGAKNDSINLENTFTELGYKVQLHESLTEEETMKAVQDIKRTCTVEAPQALFVFFLSHGVNSKEFQAADGKLLNIDKLRDEFTSDRCPALAKKPKIFMTNYCRGSDEERVEMDGRVRVKVPRNLVTIYAGKDGTASHRPSEEGTQFVLSLCHVLQSLKERTELRHVYYLLTDEMKERKATSPTWEDFGFKIFYLEIPCKK